MCKGEPGKNLYIILSGLVNVVDDDGISITKLRNGEVFGEMSLISGDPVGATIKVVEPTTVLYIRGQDFLKVLNRFPSLQMYFARLLSRRLARSNVMISKEFSSGMTGTLSQMPPVELFQTLNYNQKTGVLKLNLSKGPCKLFISQWCDCPSQVWAQTWKISILFSARREKGAFSIRTRPYRKRDGHARIGHVHGTADGGLAQTRRGDRGITCFKPVSVVPRKQKIFESIQFSTPRIFRQAFVFSLTLTPALRLYAISFFEKKLITNRPREPETGIKHALPEALCHGKRPLPD